MPMRDALDVGDVIAIDNIEGRILALVIFNEETLAKELVYLKIIDGVSGDLVDKFHLVGSVF